MSLLYFINGYVSTKRVQKFLAAPEVEKHGSELSREQNGARRDQAESVSTNSKMWARGMKVLRVRQTGGV